MSDFRVIPSVEQLRQRDVMRTLETRYGRTAVIDALRGETAALRDELGSGRLAAVTLDDAVDRIEQGVEARLRAAMLHHRIEPAELKGRLFVVSAESLVAKLAIMVNGEVQTGPLKAHIEEVIDRRHIDLVVIDPLAVFLPGNNENAAASITQALLPLNDLTTRGIAVLLLHHPRKGATLPGQSFRGTGALASNVDTLIDMSALAQPEDDDRRRWLRAYSRHEETRKNLVIELNPAGQEVWSYAINGRPLRARRR